MRFTIGLLLLVASSIVAEPIPAGMKVGLVQFLNFGYQGLKSNITRAAEKMPADDFGFAPSTMPGMRSYGRVIAHVAEGQFDVCAADKGQPNPMANRKLEEQLTGKADIVKALADAFALCDTAFATLTDATAAEYVPRGKGHMARSALLAGVLATAVNVRHYHRLPSSQGTGSTLKRSAMTNSDWWACAKTPQPETTSHARGFGSDRRSAGGFAVLATQSSRWDACIRAGVAPSESDHPTNP